MKWFYKQWKQHWILVEVWPASLRLINSKLSLAAEWRFEEVVALLSWVVLVACVNDKWFCLAVSGIWILFLKWLQVAWLLLISTPVRSPSNPDNSLVILGCGHISNCWLTIIRLEVEIKLAVWSFYCTLNIRWKRTILDNCNWQ